jgi:hypothetical protein
LKSQILCELKLFVIALPFANRRRSLYQITCIVDFWQRARTQEKMVTVILPLALKKFEISEPFTKKPQLQLCHQMGLEEAESQETEAESKEIEAEKGSI